MGDWLASIDLGQVRMAAGGTFWLWFAWAWWTGRVSAQADDDDVGPWGRS